ncbi:MAG: toxin [candidate division SR1 bacterium]|nr:MAG: toxin [candidate division SR1 bacterium]
MKTIHYDPMKRKLLLEDKTRAIDLELVKQMILIGEVVDVVRHPSRIHQKIFILDYKGYCAAVPFVENDDEIFLKTAYHSRAFEALYFANRNSHENCNSS